MMSIEATEKLIEHVKGHFSDEDLDLIERACTFAETYYAKIDHPIGIPYIDYAKEVATILDDLHFDSVVIAAAITYPPPPVKENVLDDLRIIFKDVQGLVKLVEEILNICHFEWNAWSIALKDNENKERMEVLKRMFLLSIEGVESENQEQHSRLTEFFQTKEKQIENLMRMLLVIPADIHSLIIKLADHLYFIKCLKNVSQERQESLKATLFAQLTIAIYAPLADRLGLWQLKSKLEDMAFRLLQPARYHAIAHQLAAKKQEREEYLTETIIPNLENLLQEFDIKASIFGRAKHIYGIHQKMEAKHLAFEHINDLLGIRIIVPTIEECYFSQEIIHSSWPPVTEFYGGEPGTDWIKTPKENGYQSLHTTIRFIDKLVEIQIRTHEMDKIAEYGVAAQHWRYKDNKAYRKGRTPRVTKAKEQNWDQQLTELRKSLTNGEDLPRSTQKNLSKDRVYVITPKGHVIDFRAGATPLDFAYRIHTDLGHRYRGAKTDGRLVHLDYKLKTGEIVELLTSRPKKNPSPDWLSQKKDDEGKRYYVFAQTAQTRSKIRNELNRRNRLEHQTR